MKTIHLFLSFLVYNLGLVSAWGQLPSARFDRLYPPSAQQGAELEVTVAGEDLEGVQWLKFSHDAIKAEPKKDEDGEIVPNVFTLKVAANAPLGIHKGWIGGGKFGASNYRSFVVGDLPQVEAGEGGTSREEAFELELGQTALGKSPASKFAWFKFSATKGQRVLVEVSTKDIDSKLTPSLALYDAAGLQLQSDPQNGLLDFIPSSDGEWFVRLNDFLYKGGDDYVYRLTASTRPRIDLVYPPVGKAGTNARFTLYGRNLPGGQSSDWKTKDGHSLEKKVVNIQLPSGDARSRLNLTDYLDPRRASLDHFEYRLKSPAGTSSAIYVGYGENELLYEAEGDNYLPGRAQKVSVPCEFVGKFFPGSDKDRLRFSAKQGEVYQIEVFSERMGRPSHVFLLLEQLTKQDDGEETAKEIGQSLETASTVGGNVFDVSTRDPSLRFEAPADGDYRILVYDLFNSAPDPLNVYRLSIRKETPDFRLAAYGLLPPSVKNKSSPVYVKSPTIRKGEAFPVKVMALRRDGFQDAIDLEVKGLPAFVSYSPKRIPEGADSVTVLFQPNDKATDWAGLFSISGKAKVGGKEVRRDCRFADVAWSSYDNQSKVAHSHIHVVSSVPFAILGRESTPVKVLMDDAKLVESAKKAAETAEKSFQDARSKLTQAREKLKAPVEAEKKAEAEVMSKMKELADKEKERDDLVNVRIKVAKGKSTQADAAYAKADGERKQADAAQKAATSEVAKAKAAFAAADKVAKTAAAAAVAAKAKATTVATALANATKDVTGKKTAAATAKKALDTLVATKQKPAMTAVTTATTALTAATAAKTTADKALTTAKATLTKATTNFQAADKVAKDAEAKAKVFAADPNNPKPEKDKAMADALAKRKLATVAKTALTTATTVHATTMTKMTAAAAVLTTATTKKTTAEKSLAAVNLMVTTAMTGLKTAESALAVTRTTMKTAMAGDAKAKTDLAAADKLAADKLASGAAAKTAHDNLTDSKLNPAKQRLVAADKALSDAKGKKDVATKEVAQLEADLKKADQEIATVSNAVKQAEQKFTTAMTSADKARAEVTQAEAAQAGKKKELEASKARLADATKRKDNPAAEAYVFATAVSGLIKIPVKLDYTEEFKAATKIKVYGHKGFSKVKEINIDPKKKNEGTIELNLSQAKLPAGEYPLFCSAQVKGKYKIFSEEEAKKATEDAKKVDESLKAAKALAADAKKTLDDAKKKIDEVKAAAIAAEAELAKANK
ncbi:MAG: hypothetical protein VCA36_09910, partial [Opitutales bacterium]